MLLCACTVAGTKDDGSIKVRSIDDLTACLVNLCTTVQEKLRCDTLDMLFEVLVMFMALLQVPRASAPCLVVAFCC